MSTQPGPPTEAEMPRKAPQPSERPVNARTAAEFLQMHVRSVMRLAGVGHIPGHPIGYGQRKKWLFYISELDEWLRAQICCEASRRRQGKGGQVA
jgi:Helix-turn-helix domain